MALSWSELLEDINEYFVDITRDKIFNKKTDDFETHVRSCLKLNKKEDWNYIIASEDILEDSNAAIENFLRFGLSGPTKLDCIGEKYLRLYGVLNASYLQQQAILNLIKYFQIPKLSEYKAKIDSLELRALRNKLGAHSVDYDAKSEGEIQAFVPIRAMIEDFKVDHFEHRNNSYHQVDLKSAVEEHLKLICFLYVIVVEKSIATIYKSNADKINSLLAPLEPFKEMLNGASLTRIEGENTYIVIKSVSPKDLTK